MYGEGRESSSALAIKRYVWTMSKPTVVISIVDGSFSSLHSTSRAWHIDAVRGRPPHQIFTTSALRKTAVAPTQIRWGESIIVQSCLRGREWREAKAEAGLTIEFVSPSARRGGPVVFFSLRPVQIPLIPRAEFVVFRVSVI